MVKRKRKSRKLKKYLKKLKKEKPAPNMRAPLYLIIKQHIHWKPSREKTMTKKKKLTKQNKHFVKLN